MEEKLLQGPSPNENTDLDKFIDTTEVVFDERGRYTVIYKTYPKYTKGSQVGLSTFIGVNVWMELEDSEEPFDLKYEYYKYIVASKSSLGLTHLYVTPTELVDIPSREADIIDLKLLEYVKKIRELKFKYRLALTLLIGLLISFLFIKYY